MIKTINEKPVFEPVSQFSASIVESLAYEIWQEHYTFVDSKLNNYMLDKYQSRSAIIEQIQNGYKYYLIKYNTESVGYIGIKCNKNELFLSKLYLKASCRGLGIGKEALDFIENIARFKNISKITLQVNKNNFSSINVYRKIGYKISGASVEDIGEGFAMDIYTMSKTIKKLPEIKKEELLLTDAADIYSVIKNFKKHNLGFCSRLRSIIFAGLTNVWFN